MEEAICVLCSFQNNTGLVQKHPVIPLDIAREAGQAKPKMLMMCNNCFLELLAWYSAKVSGFFYDPASKRFENKPPSQMVNEYQSAFGSFTKYKKRQKNLE
jgi:hypothetical protein